MSNINSTEAIAIIDDSITLIATLRAALKVARESLSPMVEDNKKLKAISDTLQAEDEAVDAAVARLQAKLSEAVDDGTPVVTETTIEEVAAVIEEASAEAAAVEEAKAEDTNPA